MPMTGQGAVVLSCEINAWLGNQRGKHTSHFQKCFLSLQLGKNLVCFLCFAVKREEEGWGPSAFKQQQCVRPVSGLRAWLLLAKERTGARLDLPPSSISSSPYTAARDLQHFLFWEDWELTVFMKWTWPRKYSEWSACALEKVLSRISHHKVFELLFIKAQPEPAAMQTSRQIAIDIWHWITKILAYISIGEVRVIHWL